MRRAIAAALVRSIAVVVVLVAVYYVGPTSPKSSSAIIIRVAIGSVMIALVVFWQVRSVSAGGTTCGLLVRHAPTRQIFT